jgi:hypothetical protein
MTGPVDIIPDSLSTTSPQLDPAFRYVQRGTNHFQYAVFLRILSAVLIM